MSFDDAALEAHTLAIGKIVVNLQSLEFILRLFLRLANNEAFEIPKPNVQLVPLSYMTKWATLGQLIRDFNKNLNSHEKNYAIDPMVVELRDTLAHGWALSEIGIPMTLYKFGKPTGQQVPVEKIVVMDTAWLEAQRVLVRRQIDKIGSCISARWPGIFNATGQ
jgi:hypothetical protein